MAEGGPAHIREADENLDTPPTHLSSEEKAIEAIKHTSKYVKLNIGGSLYYTTLDTLTKQDNMLRAMFSGRLDVKTDEDGWVLIDRDGRHFGTMLNYLRDGSVPLPETKKETQELLAEAKYYLIDGLTRQLETHLQDLEENIPLCRVPVITSVDEEQKILSKSNKPVIKLLYNRANNKYSYTNTSDDNLLKNIELFDKLSVKFSGRVRFVKDICGPGRGEICCWTYYGSGKKVAEVCCESIVYATERKQTKIEFPEARILEETLNIMLYEMRCEEEEKAKAARLRGIGSRTPEAILSEDEM